MKHLSVAVLLILFILVGCGKNEDAVDKTQAPPAASSTVAATAATPPATLATAPQQPTPAGADTLPLLVVTTDVLNLRSGPGTENAVVLQLKQGDAIQGLDRSADGTWLQVRLLDGTTCWLSAEFVRPANGDLIDPDGEVISTWTYGDCQ